MPREAQAAPGRGPPASPVGLLCSVPEIPGFAGLWLPSNNAQRGVALRRTVWKTGFFPWVWGLYDFFFFFLFIYFFPLALLRLEPAEFDAGECLSAEGILRQQDEVVPGDDTHCVDLRADI